MSASVDAGQVEAWILREAERWYGLVGVAFGGGDSGKWLAERVAVAVFVTLTFASFRLVARELRNMVVQASAIAGQLGDIAYSLFKAVVYGAVLAMLFMWTRRLCFFVFPALSTAMPADTLRTHIASETWVSTAADWLWRRISDE